MKTKFLKYREEMKKIKRKQKNKDIKKKVNVFNEFLKTHEDMTIE